jgi:hypothetical protein
MFLDCHFEVTRKQVIGVCHGSLYRVLENSGRMLKRRYKITPSLQILTTGIQMRQTKARHIRTQRGTLWS